MRDLTMRGLAVRRLTVWLATVVAALLCLPPAHAQLDPATTPVRPEAIRNGVYVFFGAGGNVGVSIGDDGAIIVDTQFAPMAPKIEAAVKALTAKPITTVINTHWHYDHTGGNEAFSRGGRIIVAQENTRLRMMKDSETLGVKVPAAPAIALPIVTFADTADLHMNGLSVHMFYVPAAHTDTDAVVHFREADIIHTGDVYTRATYPFVDVDSGGSLRGMIAARKRILALCGPNTVIIPGHGALSNAAELKDSIAMLEEMDRRITAAVAAGKPLADLLAENPTKDFDAVYAPRPDQGKVFVTRAYEELVRIVPRKKS
jgi:glyoxylase-like metal-dependent hydrolase (beta-lactamase superfamily II)